MLLLAQTALAGDGGWLGAGLLGLVLAWLLFWHLPAKDKQLEELMKVKDAQLENQAKMFRESLGALIAAYKEETESCRRDREADRAAFLEALSKRP